MIIHHLKAYNQLYQSLIKSEKRQIFKIIFIKCPKSHSSFLVYEIFYFWCSYKETNILSFSLFFFSALLLLVWIFILLCSTQNDSLNFSSAKAISLDTSTLWVTHGKTFETWICPLAHLLCGYCNDVILRY